MGACRSNLAYSRHLEPRHQRAQRHAKWGTHETRSLGNTRKGGSDGETNAVGAALMTLIVGELCSRPLLTLTLSPLCEVCNETRNAPITGTRSDVSSGSWPC